MYLFKGWVIVLQDIFCSANYLCLFAVDHFCLIAFFYSMAQQCPGRKGFSPGALMSCFLSSPKWCPILRNSPASVLVVWTYIRVWQIHSALFGNFSGTEVNKSDSDSSGMEPGWQLDASPGFLDPSVHALLRDSSLSSAAPQEEWLGRTQSPDVSRPGMISNESFGPMIKRGFLQFLWVKSLQN